MIRLYSFFLFSLLLARAAAQTDEAITKDIKAYQNELNAEYKNPATSPLDSVAVKKFVRHEFYPVDLNYRVQGRFSRTPEEKSFNMKTSGVKTPEYVKYGVVEFILSGKPYKLSVYQNIAFSKKAEYKDDLFLPFTDNTNGEETYGGGRYIDLKIPATNLLVVDFNKAYNPYCAYVSGKYSCPIPPKENHLDTEVKAGIKHRNDH